MRKLIWLALLLACIVLPLGAYVRLSGAGLGCPDWPGCYGQISPAQAAPAIHLAVLADPDGPVSLGKAWKEMVHRYLASALGMCLLLYGWQAWRQRRGRRAATLLLLLLVLQAGLGMWTVTGLLQPAVVSAHLLLGMLLTAVLAWQALQPRLPSLTVGPACLWQMRGLLLLLLGQVVLGGWVSSHQAALVCQGFPQCNGSWWPALQIGQAFSFSPTGWTEEGLITMHWLHRLLALLVVTGLCGTAWQLWPYRSLRSQLRCLLLAVLLQVGLGICNVLLQRPLLLSLAHTMGAMLVLVLLFTLLCRLQTLAAWRPGRIGHQHWPDPSLAVLLHDKHVGAGPL